MDYYADAQWTDETEPLLQRLVVQGFEKSGKIPAVAREREGMHADLLLQIEVRNFVARYASDTGAPTADVELIAKLVTPERRMVVATLDAHHQVAATANSVPAAVAAFNAATGQTVNEIVAWTLQNGGAAVTPGATGKAPPVRRRRRHR
jgi:cholesterol transport system auxiliary component